MTVLRFVSLGFLLSATVSGCSLLPSWLPDPAEPAGSADTHPDVLVVELRPVGERVYDVVVTISSPYDTPERYTDGWRVFDPDGNVLGTHTLLHDHAGEQPFTRTQRGLSIPADVTSVTVEGRDQVYGYGGATVTVDVPA